MLALTSLAAEAENCSDYPNGIIDGATGTPAPSQIQIDRNCTIRNYPASNPLSTNFSFLTQPGQTEERWLVVFDNVVHTGQMACNSVAEHKIWFTNGSSTSIKDGCQNLLIPVEKIDKQNPPGQTTATVGVPFTYRLVMPVLFDPATNTVINTSGSLNDLHGVTVVDDLNATGVRLTYLGHEAYWLGDGTPVAHTFSNVGGVLTFDDFPIVPTGEQIIVEITVVLDDHPSNVSGTQFVNVAKWDFGRLIEGVFYEPLPGEWGISPPLTIANPELVVTKNGPATLGRTLNLGEWGEFSIDVRNDGLSDAWNVALVDRFPDGPSGGMCDMTPQLLDARVFAADGVTPVPGKGPLVAGTDFSMSYTGFPQCELTLAMHTAAAVIGAGERLIFSYRTQLDSDSQEGATLTNVAGATRWFNDQASNPDRQAYNRTVTNGTPGVVDHQDAHTVTVALSGFFFEKTVANLTTGVSPTNAAAPGDRLRYTLRLQTTDVALDNITFRDDMGALNALPAFVPGSLSLVASTIPAGANTSNTNPSGGTNGAGVLDVRNLNVPANSEVRIQFDITLASNLPDGTVVLNQADLIRTVKLADSDDPFVNGQADPNVDGDEDPTAVLIEASPPSALSKANTQSTATIGEEFRYRITVPSVPSSAPLYDVRITDDLLASAADLRFVDVTRISGSGPWVPVNTGTSANVVIEDPGSGIDIPAGEQVVIEITVLLMDTSTNVAGLTFTNTAAYTYNLLDGNGASRRPGGPGTTPPMTIVEPRLVFEKSGPAQMRIGLPGTFTLDVRNIGTSPAYAVTVTDRLPSTGAGGMCDAPPAQVVARVFQADGVTPASPVLAAGTDYTVAFTGDPACTFTLTTETAAAAIGPGQRLIVTYQASLDAGTNDSAMLTNVAGATEWFSTDLSTASSQVREYMRSLTNGTVGVLDHEDAHTVLVFSGLLIFEKTVVNVTTGADPATTARPGDRLRYTLHLENVGAVPVADFHLVDELDRLNQAPGFRSGTLSLVTVPAGADTSGTNANGGTSGTGLLDVGGLGLGVGESLLVVFEVELAPVLANGSYVANQSQMQISGAIVQESDDPTVNGAADPVVVGDEDPTRVLIESAPQFDVDKVSSDISGDPDLLLPGETLRYTITVRNVGNDHARDAVLRDALPANTTYVAGSTTLNGVAVADGPSGALPLAAGMTIQAPGAATGFIPADAAASDDNMATIEFEVVVDADVIDGTVISNQGFVSAIDGGVVDQPSDDPRTAAVDDPTRDVVGNLPLMFSEKSVSLHVDGGSPGIVDPGDVLLYTIRIHNTGTVAATDVVLRDDVPANTGYVPDTLTLNGLPVGRPDGGAFPLAAGIPVSSSDLTPPLPGPGEGTISRQELAEVQFQLRVDDGVPPGTLITNQALVTTEEIGNQLTDGDGNPATGPEPTVVVVGDVQQLALTKQVSVVGGGSAVAGATLEYVVQVRNIGTVPAQGVVITDDLDDPASGQLTFVDQSWTMNGQAAGITVMGSLLSADYSVSNGSLDPGESILLRFQAALHPELSIGTTVVNVAHATWNTDQTASASVAIDVGGRPGVGVLNGTAWHDADFDDQLGDNERPLDGWTVELYRNDQRLHTTVTDADGVYVMSGLAPNHLSGDEYEIRFVAPGAGASTALLGEARSDFTNGLQRISAIIVEPGSNLQHLDLPIDPNGVVYDSVVRVPVAGATLRLVNAGSGMPVPAGCLEDPAQQDQVTRSDGYYKFDLNFSGSACPSGAVYVIEVTEPVSGYAPGYSEIIPPTGADTGQAFDVPACPGSADDALPATADHCEVQVSELAPGSGIEPRSPGTTYYVTLLLDGSEPPGSSQIFNNHIPLDPILDGAVFITKTTPLLNVVRGQQVPYTISVRNTFGLALNDVTVVDRYPPGFKYVEGSARVDGVPVEPVLVGRELHWRGLTLGAEAESTIRLLLVVGAGVSEGEYVNRAQAVETFSATALSGEATATVRIVPDPTFDCTDVLGKVFDDKNRNGIQDPGEAGLPGVRLATARGLIATTDQYGRYHITCAVTPREDRGSNFVLKLDDRTLPSGYRSSTDLVMVKRATRGKALRFSFGASIHRVVGLDVADAVFEPDTTDIRRQWIPRFDLLLDELKQGPAVLRIAYLADIEDPALVERRLEVIKKRIVDAWNELDCCYRLSVETDVFWRLGGPPSQVIRNAGTSR